VAVARRQVTLVFIGNVWSDTCLKMAKESANYVPYHFKINLNLEAVTIEGGE
jgi:hypothetical protein